MAPRSTRSLRIARPSPMPQPIAEAEAARAAPTPSPPPMTRRARTCTCTAPTARATPAQPAQASNQTPPHPPIAPSRRHHKRKETSHPHQPNPSAGRADNGRRTERKGRESEEPRALVQERAEQERAHMAEEAEEAVPPPPPAAMVEEEDAAAAAVDFGLPAELMSLLPSDPFALLDVARKVTSMALSHRLGRLEAEAARLRSQLADRDAEAARLRSLLAEREAEAEDLRERVEQRDAEAEELRERVERRDAEAEDLRERVEQLDAALAVATGRLRRAEEEKEALQRDNSALSSTIAKLNRDVAKLEVFRKTLVQSLQEDDSSDNTAPGASAAATSNFSSAPSDEDSAFPNTKSSQISETASSVSEENIQVDPDAPRPRPRPGRPHVFLPSYNGTPRMTPPGSPPRRFASVSPPRRHSISVTSMNMFNDRSSGFSGQHTSPFDAPSQTGRTRVDGKEFFRQVRNRLSYEQFGAFLANVKELNAHRQTREDTLRKADEIFGPENKDLYTIFESLITRNVR